MSSIFITAHSGCEGTPDNSLVSVQTGLSLGADCIEVDVRLDAHGILRMSHDPEQVCSAVLLSDAFRLLMNSPVCINCDLKEYRTLLPALRLAEEMCLPPSRLIFSGSVDIRTLLAAPHIAHRAQIFLNSEELCTFMDSSVPADRMTQTDFLLAHRREAAALMRKLNASCLNAPYQFMPHDAIALLRHEGIELSLWTANDEASLTCLLQEDLLNITTRIPRRALQLRQEYQPAPSNISIT